MKVRIVSNTVRNCWRRHPTLDFWSLSGSHESAGRGQSLFLHFQANFSKGAAPRPCPPSPAGPADFHTRPSACYPAPPAPNSGTPVPSLTSTVSTAPAETPPSSSAPVVPLPAFAGSCWHRVETAHPSPCCPNPVSFLAGISFTTIPGQLASHGSCRQQSSCPAAVRLVNAAVRYTSGARPAALRSRPQPQLLRPGPGCCPGRHPKSSGSREADLEVGGPSPRGRLLPGSFTCRR